MTKKWSWSRRFPGSVGAAMEAIESARGETRAIMRIFEHRHVPMVLIDTDRRYVEVNRPARLALGFSREEMRGFSVDDLAPARVTGDAEQAWARLLDAGWVAGRGQIVEHDGRNLDVVYCGLARVLPGLHLIAFVPAAWPEHELDPTEEAPIGDDRGNPVALTSRQIELLALVAEGHTGSELAQELVLSPDTIKSHFKNIYQKLGVRTRCAAVAKAMRLGLID